MAMTVADLEAALEQHVQAIMGAAWNCPPGGNHAWDQTMAYYRVAGDPPAERVNEAVNRGMTRGAIPREVTRVLQAVAAWAQGELAAHIPSSGMISDPRLGALTVRISRLAVSETQRYEAAVYPNLAPSVGSIFANASSTAGQAPWKNIKVEPTSVLVCVHCGAPQQAALNFICKYCNKPMATKERA
ncbi:MAG: hypothetical protein HY898_28080 [Deltaproteobacteria bacterium]|nr:hypothetical protein [Deltaproteobacteria bacterium]